MIALRGPFAALGGAVFSLAVFLGLWRLVNVPFDVDDVIKATTVVYTPQRRDTPLEIKRDPKVQRERPALTPSRPGITRGDEGGGITATFRPTRITPAGPTIDTTISGTDRDVLPLVRVEPDYPPRAIVNGTEGWVRVRFSITATGTVRDVTVVESEPGTTFDEAAAKAVARWRYNPRIDAGVPVERVGVETIIRFALQ